MWGSPFAFSEGRTVVRSRFSALLLVLFAVSQSVTAVSLAILSRLRTIPAVDSLPSICIGV